MKPHSTLSLLLLPIFIVWFVAAEPSQAGDRTVHRANASGSAPISLHPENSHYFLWRGKPTVLLTSAEHYGAVLNSEFNGQAYLDTLAADELNYTRIFSGAYVEPLGAFGIARNTLAPEVGKLICPWARSTEPGYANGGNKFDLTQWDAAYFARLKDYVDLASQRNIVVEVTLFCPMYGEEQWALSPMNVANNVNGVGIVQGHSVHTLDQSGGLLSYQESLVRKMVTELNPFDNVIYEICNEPYFGGVALDWQHHIVDTIVQTERKLPHQHLIAQNIANQTATIERPHPAVSIFNFHYATPPVAVTTNYSLNRAIGDDETGFNGQSNESYRTEGWAFIMAGGSLYNNLDYSFTAGHENGTYAYPANQPGGGNPTFRNQMKTLGSFIRSFDFIRMKPDPTVIKGSLPKSGKAWALVQPDQAMAIYLHTPESAATNLLIELPKGQWQADWIDPKTGQSLGKSEVPGGLANLIVPNYQLDIAVRLTVR